MKRILIIGPDRNTRGGISSVIKSHEKTKTWEKFNCKWISSYNDKSSLHKVLFFLMGLIIFLYYLPSANIIHIHLSEPTSAKRKNVFLIIGNFFNKITILHFHAFSSETTLFGKDKKLYVKMFNLADAVVVLSKLWKTEIDQFVINPNKINVIFNPCLVVNIDKNLPKQKIILFTGTLNRRKGYEDLIIAFSKISNKFNDWKLVLAGNGELRQANKLIKNLNLDNKIILKGWISGVEMHELYHNSSIFCLPSYAEGFPMSVLDAWAYGLPVITTPVGGLPDIIEHGENALVFTPGDIKKLIENLDLLMSNSNLRIKLSLASLKLSKESFHIDNIDKQLDNLYKYLIQQKLKSA